MRFTVLPILPLAAALLGGATAPPHGGDADREILALTYPEGETISVRFLGTARLPQANAEAKVERKKGMTEIEVELDEMKPATLFGGDYATYVLWVVSPESHVDNVGEFILDGNRSKLNVSTPLETFGMFVTAEPHFLVDLPSRFVVMENTEPTQRRPFRIGRIPYEGSRRNYVFEHESLEHFEEAKGEVRAHLQSARVAVSLAERARAGEFASQEIALAREALRRAELAQEKGVTGEDLMILAHESIRRSVEAQKLAEERGFEAALASERRAREGEIAKLQAELDKTTSEADRARLLAEKKEMETQIEARARQEAVKQSEEAFARARRAEERAREAAAAKLRAEQEKLDAERAEARAQEEAVDAIREAEQARSELRAALGRITHVRESARGLMVSLPDILFESGAASLRPEGREVLAKLSGVLQVAGDYELQIEGHTDDVGSEEYNFDLSRRRAESVRDFLFSNGVEWSRLAVVGRGESRPLAGNDSPEGRRKNRRVEIVIVDAAAGVAADVSGTPPR